MSPEAEPSQDVLTTVRKRIELVINEIADAELIAMLRTAMSELDALAQSDAGPVLVFRKMTGDYIEASRLKPTPPRPDASTFIITGGRGMSSADWARERRSIGGGNSGPSTAPPRPDASAGLIEAAVRAAFEEAAQIADSFGDRHDEFEPGDAIRAHAADRSGK